MYDLGQLAKLIASWQRRTFPDATPATALRKLRHEMDELEANPLSAEEMADCFFMLVAVADLSGVNLGKAVARKMEKNQARTWAMGSDGTYSHATEAPADAEVTGEAEG